MKTTARDPLDWLNAELEELARSDLRRSLRIRAGGQGPTIELGGRRLINFGSNDYLSLASDRRLVGAAADTLRTSGWGAGASPLVNGRSAMHAELEAALADFEGTEAALLFSSGFAANVGAIAALVGRGDAVFTDAKNHASLIDGCRLSRAEIHIYRHRDCDHLERLLRDAPRGRRRMIVTDSLFSMDGDLAPLVEIAQLRDRFECMLLVDEAHATGVFGSRGRGVAEHFGVEDKVDVKVGTLSKALGCSGGFVCGRRTLIDWLVNRARPYVFSTAHPDAGAAAARAALEIVRTEPQRRQQLLARAAGLREQFATAGWDVGESRSQIIPIRLGEADRAMEFAERLAAAGFFVPGIRPPSVPEGESLLRLSLCCGHTQQMLDGLLAALEQSRRAS